MKQQFTIIAMLFALLLCACSSEDNETAIKSITFHVSNIQESYTRASLSEASLTDLWVFEGSTLLKHQTSEDSDFGKPTVSLTYGSHQLTFVASKAQGQAFSSGDWTCTKVGDTFGKAQSVSVTATTGNTLQVELPRRSAQVCFHIEDAIPVNVKTMVIEADNNLSLTSDLTAGTATVYQSSVDVTSKQGVTDYQPVVNLLPTSATAEEDCNVVLSFLDQSGNVLYKFERVVKVLANRCTTLKGEYFTGGENTITVNTTWLDELEVPLWQ